MGDSGPTIPQATDDARFGGAVLREPAAATTAREAAKPSCRPRAHREHVLAPIKLLAPVTRIGYNICGYDFYQSPDARSRAEERVGRADHPVDRRGPAPSRLRDQPAGRAALGRAAEVPHRVA